jgi:hypothetical protein
MIASAMDRASHTYFFIFTMLSPIICDLVCPTSLRTAVCEDVSIKARVVLPLSETPYVASLIIGGVVSKVLYTRAALTRPQLQRQWNLSFG